MTQKQKKRLARASKRGNKLICLRDARYRRAMEKAVDDAVQKVLAGVFGFAEMQKQVYRQMAEMLARDMAKALVRRAVQRFCGVTA